MTTSVAPARRAWDRPLLSYWALAFGITWGVGGLGLIVGDITPDRPSPLHPLHYLAAFGPSLAGVILTARIDGWGGIRRLFARAAPRRSSVGWYVAALVGFPVLNVIAARLMAANFLEHLPGWNRLVVLLPLTLVADTGPLGEEFGWRGFALPRLLQRYRPLAAAVILGVVWWAWHLPLFFIPSMSQHELSAPLFLVNVVALSVIMTWLYRRTRGDLLLMILVHVAANYCGWIGVPFIAEVAVEVACAGLIVACGGLRQS
jgi:CAAX protease family protein